MLDRLPSANNSKKGWPWTIESSAVETTLSLPRVSVITPCFNQGGFIEESIRSVILQNYPNLQYIIIDGGSTDGTIDIIKKYETHIDFWVSEKDKGQSHAINKGLKIATGSIIVWLNSDDFYNENALAGVAKVFSENQNVNCVIGKISVFNDNKSYIKPIRFIYKTTEKTAGYGGMSQPAMFFGADVYKTIGLLNENLNYCMDLEWWLKYLLTSGIEKIKTIPTVLVNFRLHDNSKTVSDKNKFISERNSIYYSIAKQLNFPDKAAVIESMGSLNHEYSFQFPAGTNFKVAEKILDYFLLFLGDEKYISFEKMKANACFSIVNEKNLADDDKNYLKRLKFKNTYVPQFLIKKIRQS